MKVCIIGNNLTSLILASILSKKNFFIQIYSVKGKELNFKTRTLGITSYNLDYLQNYFKGISKKTHPIEEIKVLINNEKINEKILFNKDLKPYFHMIKYDKLITYLKSKVKSNKFISFKYLKKNSQLLSLVKQNKFELIINCERSNILTEKFLTKGIFKNYYNKAFTTIIKHSKINNNIATQIFTKNGPIAYLPLSNSFTSVVYSIEINKKKNISEKEIAEVIKKFNPCYKILSYKNFENFHLNMKLPKKYYYKNILFFGDSIHSIHPLAGQGFNMTIRDVIKFNQIIDRKINLGLNIDQNIYKEFEKNVKNYNNIFSLGIDFIYEFFRLNRNYVPKNISQKMFNFIDKSKKIKDFSIKFANQSNLNY